MPLIETIISIQNYFLVKFGIGQIIFIRKQNKIMNEKYNDIEYTIQATLNGC